MLIGLISDTHDAIAPWADVLPKVAKAFDGAGLILHCGDLTTHKVLDDLAVIAQVVAVRSINDPDPDPPRLIEGPHVLEVDGIAIGVVNALDDLEPAALFGRPVDVVIIGGHQAQIQHDGEILLVNPGSPTLADKVTVAVLDTRAKPPKAEIIFL